MNDKPGPTATTQAEPPAKHESTWTIIVRAQGEGTAARTALGELIKRYERAVMAMIDATPHPRGLTREDLKQEFFRRFIDRGDIRKLNRERGSLRAWLFTAVRNFVKNERDKYFAAKHGAALTDVTPAENTHGITPELAYMRQFAEDTVVHALRRQRDALDERELARFDRLSRFLPGPQLDPGGMREVAAELGVLPSTAAVQVHRLRETFKEILRDVVADTLDLKAEDPEREHKITLELTFLYRLLSDVPQIRDRLVPA